MTKQSGRDEQSITISRLNDTERAKLIAAAASRKTQEIPHELDDEILSRELWLHIFQSVLASEGIDIEQQADVTRAAFNTSAAPANQETKIISKLVKNLSASEEASLIEEIQKAISQAEEEQQFTLLRKLIAVLWELERIAALKRQGKSA
jgi:hypothetical protein